MILLVWLHFKNMMKENTVRDKRWRPIVDHATVVQKADSSITGWHPVHWIGQLVSLTFIQWIEIYPVDNAIQLLNNWGQYCFFRRAFVLKSNDVSAKDYANLWRTSIERTTWGAHLTVPLGSVGRPLNELLWSILKAIFKTDLSQLLSLVFVSLSLVFVHVLFSCFDLLFLLVIEVMPSSRIYLLPY